MASILAISSLDLNEEAKTKLSRDLIRNIGRVFPDAMSFTFKTIEPRFASAMAKDQTTFIVCLPREYLPIEVKRETARILHETILAHVGDRGKYKVIVLFWYHEAADLGKDGFLFSDLPGA
jgi:hypothetical protein